MNTSTKILLAAFFLIPTLNRSAAAAQNSASPSAGATRWDIGARYHTEHSSFTDLPFGDGDFSYTIGYEYHEQTAYWQIVAGYCHAPSRTNDVDFAITPALNIIFKDGPWEGGAGILASYVSDNNDDNDDWIIPYWQLILGASFPLFGMPFSIHAYYPFENGDNFRDFEAKDIEFGAMLKFSF